jgi:hypothetical protein
MGLLDDAIREHLELKRRGGADPGEIAHKEQEALAPVFPDEEAVGVDDPQGPIAADPRSEELPSDTEIEPGEDMHGPDVRGPSADDAHFTHVGQETAELDMRSVLDGHDGSSVAPVAARPVRAAQMPVETEQDQSVWDFGASPDGAPEDAGTGQEIPGQERLTFE